MTFFSRITRAPGSSILTEDDIRCIAPSVFAVEAHESRSSRFVPIPTIEIVRGLAKEGFQPVFVSQSRTRDESRRETTKHLLRFRKEGALAVDGIFPELVLRNANDGSASYNLMAGLFRLVCGNGMVVCDELYDSVHVKHTGRDVVGDVIEGSFKVIDQATIAMEAPQAWARIQLDRPEQLLLAEAAHTLRFEHKEGEEHAIEPKQLLTPRRPEDIGNDLWRTFNVIQENAVRGGLTGQRKNGGRRMTSREVKGVDQNVKLNKALWTITDHFAKAKTGGLLQA